MQEKWNNLKKCQTSERPGSATPSQSLPPLPTALFWDISRTGSGKNLQTWVLQLIMRCPS